MDRPAHRSSHLVVAALATALALAACGGDEAPTPRRAPSAAAPVPGDATPPAAASAVRFEERAVEAGLDFRTTFLEGEQGEHFKINFYDHGSGVAVADVDGDGDDDVYLCNQLGSNALFQNDGHGRFQDVTAKAGVGLADRISVAATFADYDGDGDQDLYVTTTRGGNVLFANRGDGTFEDVTERAGLTLVAHSEQGFFFDADGDGDLDLLVTNTAKWTLDERGPGGRYWVGPKTLLDLLLCPIETNRFYRNRGDRTFEDATAESGLAADGWAGDVAIFDADDDGDLDVFGANMFGRSSMFRNDGSGRFVDASVEMLGPTSWGAVGARAFDWVGDGTLGLFVVDMHSDMWMVRTHDPRSVPENLRFHSPWGPGDVAPPIEVARRLAVMPKDVVFGSTLYRRTAPGRYAEVSDRAGVETLWPWGIAVGDFDGDGWEDAYVPTGMGYPYAHWRAPLLMNRRDGTFVDRSAAAGLDPLPGGPFQPAKIAGKPAARSSRAAATGDFDGDGRLDLVVSTFNDRALLYMNRSPARPWVGLRLVGAGANRDAIGALVRVRAGGRTHLRQVQAAGGYLAQSSAAVHLALGDATAIEGCEIRWPDGTVQQVPGLVPGRVHVVVEAAPHPPRAPR